MNEFMTAVMSGNLIAATKAFDSEMKARCGLEMDRMKDEIGSSVMIDGETPNIEGGE